MHTHTDKGIHIDLANKLEATFTWVLLLATQAKYPDDYLTGLESIDLKEIDTAFNELEKEKVKEASCNVDCAEVLKGEIYNFDELNHIDVGVAPCALEDVSAL